MECNTVINLEQALHFPSFLLCIILVVHFTSATILAAYHISSILHISKRARMARS
jgi:hypothetical protein